MMILTRRHNISRPSSRQPFDYRSGLAFTYTAAYREFRVTRNTKNASRHAPGSLITEMRATDAYRQRQCKKE